MLFCGNEPSGMLGRDKGSAGFRARLGKRVLGGIVKSGGGGGKVCGSGTVCLSSGAGSLPKGNSEGNERFWKGTDNGT